MADLKRNAYKIEYQQETVGIGADGKAAEGVKVGFVTGLGNHGSVFVPKALYSAVNVAAAVLEAANTMDEVHKLTG